MADAYSTKLYQVLGGGESLDNRQVLSADGSTTPVSHIGPVWVSLSGSFGGGTAQLQVNDGFNLVPLENGAFTGAADKVFDFPPSSNSLNVVLTSATNPALVIRMVSAR